MTRARRDLPPAPIELAVSLEAQAKTAALEGRAQEAIDCRSRLLAVSRILNEKGAAAATAYFLLANDYFTLRGWPAQTIEHCETAQKHIAGLEDRETRQLRFDVRLLNGRALYMAKKDAEALRTLEAAERTLQRLQADPGSEAEWLDTRDLELCRALARCHVRAGRSAPAAAYLDRCVLLVRRNEGDDSMSLVALYQALAKNKDDPDYAKTALQIASSSQKAGGADVAAAEVVLGRLLPPGPGAEAHLKAGATELHNSGLLKESLKAKEHLAKVLVRDERPREALDLITSCLPEYPDIFGSFSPELQEALSLAAHLAIAEGEGSRAVGLLGKLKAIQQVVYGPNHRATKETEKTEARLLSNPHIGRSSKK